MIILLDTSTHICRLVVVRDGTHFDYEWDAGRELAKGLLGYLRDALARHDAELNDLEGIGVLSGPGSFTGLRIGLTIANTLADSMSIPIVGASGADWKQISIERLERGENDRIVMPEYGSLANITTPRK
ncbi:tRNA (adenosine(37)-N6)-threonylcarbamoyltransferase complex dimerization subunit type 1 TsaB [Candidatus Nomurabacteria bacterium]|nr:tRNA (adenosine(37)-N6)-threonylcarbamoyltransferase complex dimerization subunit type 1 TsaB [Candidatus Nomurabacteria bacterium]